MNRIFPRNLKKRASVLVQENPGIRRTFLIYAAVSFGVPLAVSLIQMLLQASMTNRSGLSGMGSSAIFMTAQSTLSAVCEILLPFWQIGIIFCAMRFSRQQNVESAHLTQGFRKWGPVLRYYLWVVVLAVLAIMLLGQVLGIALIPLVMAYFAFVPMPDNWQQTLETMEEKLEVLMENPNADPAALAEILPMDVLMYLLPIGIMAAILVVVVIVHLSYRIRLSQYLLMEEPGAGAMASVSFSNRMMKGKKWGYFKLDLSFWWYYLLQMLATVLLFVPEILGLCGIVLPMPEMLCNFIFHLAYSAASVALVWKCGPYIHTTYACVYDVLRIPPDAITM